MDAFQKLRANAQTQEAREAREAAKREQQLDLHAQHREFMAQKLREKEEARARRRLLLPDSPPLPAHIEQK